MAGHRHSLGIFIRDTKRCTSTDGRWPRTIPPFFIRNTKPLPCTVSSSPAGGSAGGSAGAMEILYKPFMRASDSLMRIVEFLADGVVGVDLCCLDKKLTVGIISMQ